jgi:uncharacterized protein YutE (UPF0331/DUF86 family)
MPDLDAGRVQRYLMTLRENTEDIRDLLTRYEDDQILKDRLVHRYWEIDDQRLIRETRKGVKDFELFIQAVTIELPAHSPPPV